MQAMGLGARTIQFLLSFAILSPIAFEGIVAILHFNLRVFLEVWSVCLGFHLAYLGLVAITLTPDQWTPRESFETQ